MIKEQNIPSFAYNLPPTEYLGLVETVNFNTLKSYRDIFGSLTLSGDQTLTMVGSDGKHERHSQSKTEFVLIQEKRSIYSDEKTLTEVLLSKKYPINFELPLGYIETKNLSSDTPFSYAFGDRARVYPDRTLNVTTVAGNREIVRRARERVLREMTGDNAFSKRVRKRMNDQLRGYKSAGRKGEYQRVEVFSFDQGLQFYDESKPLQFGFKVPFLRPIQRKLDILTARAVRRNDLDIGHLARKLPVQTIDRLVFFAQMDLIDHTTVEKVSYAYSWFLREYHRAQELYKRSGQPVTMPFNKDEFARTSKVILEFSDSKL